MTAKNALSTTAPTQLAREGRRNATHRPNAAKAIPYHCISSHSPRLSCGRNGSEAARYSAMIANISSDHRAERRTTWGSFIYPKTFVVLPNA